MIANERRKKAFSILLCLCMVLQFVPTTAFAANTNNLCAHHEAHSAEVCGECLDQDHEDAVYSGEKRMEFSVTGDASLAAQAEECSEHTFNLETAQCACGTVAEARVKIGGTVACYLTMEEAFLAVENCTAEDQAVITMMQDRFVVANANWEPLIIKSGVFTLDLNGHVLSGDDLETNVLRIRGGDVTITSSVPGGEIKIDHNSGSLDGATCVLRATGLSTQVTLRNIKITLTSEETKMTFAVVLEDADMTLDGVAVDSEFVGILAMGSIAGGSLEVIGGSICGASGDLMCVDVRVALRDGVTFPGGVHLAAFSVETIPLNNMLGEGMAYWQDGIMLDLADDATSISGGPVTVKAKCTHEGGSLSCKPIENGVKHGMVYSCCGMIMESENHTVDADGFCTVCGSACPHISHDTESICPLCGKFVDHLYDDNGNCERCEAYRIPMLSNGAYEIYTADQLYWFAAEVNSGNNTINGRLMNDIVVNEGTMTADSTDARVWIPIGIYETVSTLYAGSFDGQGHTVSGLYINDSAAEFVGMFGFVYGGTVKNVGVINSYFNGDENVGGVVGGNVQGTVLNCYNTGYVYGNAYVGGVVGIGEEGRIEYCYNIGAIGGDRYVGGVLGYDRQCTLGSLYYLDTCGASGGGYKRTAEQFASGEVAYGLQGQQETHIWGQTIGTDSYPVFGGAKVYYGYVDCQKQGYSNQEMPDEPQHRYVAGSNVCIVCNAATCSHTWENGFCTGCGIYEPAALDEDGVTYLIGNVGQLYWFAEQVNSGKTSINARLTDHIVVNENVLNAEGGLNAGEFRTWTSIGEEDNRYSGTFDGAGKTVSGLYFSQYYNNVYWVGLFGYVSGGTVKNVGVVDSYFSAFSYVGGVVGYNDEGSITNCYNTGSVNGDRNVGGVVGYNNEGSITNCYNTGSVTGTGESAGGVVSGNSGIISNCYNTGSVIGKYYVGGVACNNDAGIITDSYNTGSVSSNDVSNNGRAGGVVSCNRQGKVTNCYNTGSVTSNNFVGGVVGQNEEMSTVTNCYYMEGAAAGGINGEDAAGQAEAKNAEQFASGEVAYLLQGQQETHVWGQTIGTDSYPVFGGEKVYYGYVLCMAKYANSELADIPVPHDFPESANGFCTVCGIYESAVENEDGVYEIYNAGQLYWYAQQLNENNSEIYVKLMKDIVIPETAPNWVPINASYAYFDGNFKTISGLKCIGGENDTYVGFFGNEVWWYEISNLHIADSYFEGSDYVGAVVAVMNNGGSVTNCYVTDTTVKGKDGCAGTLVGYLGMGHVVNCFVDTDTLVGYDSNGNTENSYYLSETETENGGKTAAQFASGEVAYLLQGQQEAHVWGQTIGTDAIPTLGGEKVYLTTDCENNAIYSNTEAGGQHHFVDGICTVCGAADPNYVVPTQKFDITLANLTLGNDLTLYFYIPVDVCADWTGTYAVVTKPYADGTPTATVTVPFAKWESGFKSGGKDLYRVAFNGIAAKEIADEVTIQIFNAEGKAISNPGKESVRSYLDRFMEKNAADATKMRLAIDMLNYGAAAQTHFGYNTDNLANAGLSDEQKAFGTATAPACVNGNVKGANTKGSNLTLESSILMNFYFNGLTEDMYAMVTFTDHTGKVHNEKLGAHDGSRFTVNQVVVADARQLVTVTVYNADGSVYGTCTDSVESYVARARDAQAKGLDLYEAIIKFADSAYTYLHNR